MTLDETNIDSLELSVRTTNCLRSYGLRTFGDIRKYFTTRSKSTALREIKNFGAKSYNEVMNVIMNTCDPIASVNEQVVDAMEPLAVALWHSRADMSYIQLAQISSAISLRKMAQEKTNGDD